MSNPGMSGPAEGHDGNLLSRELTPSESGEGNIFGRCYSYISENKLML